MSQNLQIEIKETTEDLIVIFLDGSLDTYTSAELEKFFSKQVEERKIKFAIDCENLRFVSSSGMGCFINTLKKLNDEGGIRLYHLSGKAEETLKVLGKYHKLFGITSTKEEAINSLNEDTMIL